MRLPEYMDIPVRVCEFCAPTLFLLEKRYWEQDNGCDSCVSASIEREENLNKYNHWILASWDPTRTPTWEEYSYVRYQ